MTLIRCCHSGPEWTRERWQWRGTPHSTKLQHCWNLTIRLFSVIPGHSLGGLAPLQSCSHCILQPQSTVQAYCSVTFIWAMPLRCSNVENNVCSSQMWWEWTFLSGLYLYKKVKRIFASADVYAFVFIISLTKQFVLGGVPVACWQTSWFETS